MLKVNVFYIGLISILYEPNRSPFALEFSFSSRVMKRFRPWGIVPTDSPTSTPKGKGKPFHPNLKRRFYSLKPV